MDDRPVIRMTWEEWQAGRAAKRDALRAKGLAGESRRTTARPEAKQALAALRVMSHAPDQTRDISR